MVEELTKENFTEKIKDSKAIVDFWASWCAPCRMMAPEFEAAAKEVDGVVFFKVNVEEQQELAGQFGIRGIPTVIFFDSGKEKHRFSGARQKTDILNEVKQVFG